RGRLETESDVVYLMVELRKLLEHDKQKETYPVVNFYCNWSVHTKLTKSSIADRLVTYFDELHKRFEAGFTTIPICDELAGLVGYANLRRELRDCLEHFGLPTAFCVNEGAWGFFLVRLGN